jgi:ribosomal protein S18 acetylase RimI-like enzyme
MHRVENYERGTSLAVTSPSGQFTGRCDGSPRRQNVGSNVPPKAYVAASWTPRSAASRAMEVLRESGPRLLARKIFAEVFYRRLIVYEARLDGPRRVVRLQVPVQFELLGNQEVADYLACVPDANADEIERHMRVGDRCYTARVFGEIVAVRWAAFRDVRVTSLGLTLRVGDEDVYLYGAYTRPQWRRNGIGAALTADILDRLEAEGYHRALSAWMPENVPARSLHFSRGEPVAIVGVVRIGPWKRQLRPRPIAAGGRFY